MAARTFLAFFPPSPLKQPELVTLSPTRSTCWTDLRQGFQEYDWTRARVLSLVGNF
uniref:Uncharacterized protein n=1 Tax=Anguilla anguilla TaxID=7936 RepID=A0A0E9QLE0_ANGAN